MQEAGITTITVIVVTGWISDEGTGCKFPPLPKPVLLDWEAKEFFEYRPPPSYTRCPDREGRARAGFKLTPALTGGRCGLGAG